jgi:hypothetical protein
LSKLWFSRKNTTTCSIFEWGSRSAAGIGSGVAGPEGSGGVGERGAVGEWVQAARTITTSIAAEAAN